MAHPALAEDDRMTVDAFIALAQRPDGLKYELVDGVLRAMSPATVRHGAIQARVASILDTHLRSRGSPCRAITEPAVSIPLNAQENMRIPDVGVTCQTFDEKTVALPEPILLVEILSPGNRNQTMENVRAYMTIPSLQEILVIDSVKFAVTLLSRKADGAWPTAFEAFGQDDDLTLHSVGLTVPARAVYP